MLDHISLEEHLEGTKDLRQNETSFIASIIPHRPAGTQTLARWIKVVLKGAGIDVSSFKPHSTRHAPATAAFAADFLVDEILKGVCWSSAVTFKRFYRRL